MWRNAVTIQEVETGVTDTEAEYATRRPFLYDKMMDTLYVGNQGTHHFYLAKAAGLGTDWHRDPDVYAGEVDSYQIRWYEAPDNQDEIEQALMEWTPDEQITNPSFESVENVNSLWQISKVGAYEPLYHPDDIKYGIENYELMVPDSVTGEHRIPNSIWYDAWRIPPGEREEWLEDVLAQYVPWSVADKEIQDFYDESDLVRPSKGRAPGESERPVETPEHIHQMQFVNHPHYQWRIPVHYYPDSGQVYTAPAGDIHASMSHPHAGDVYQGFLGIPGQEAVRKGYTPGFSWLEERPSQAHHDAVVKALTPMFPYASQPFAFKRDEDDLWGVEEENSEVPVDSRFRDSNPFRLGEVTSDEKMA